MPGDALSLIDLASRLGASMVDVWTVRLAACPAVAVAYRSVLSPEEAARADRFAFPSLRQSYELSHGALRMLLARRLRAQPRDIAFTFGPKGKPALAGNSQLRFNMSHSGSLALLAFTTDCEIGVDVEQVRAMADIEQIASSHFCSEETSELLSLDGEMAKQEAFFRCWTRKEAYIKAVGDGLSMPLDRFQVTLLPDVPPRLVRVGIGQEPAAGWTLQHLEPAPGYVGAVAYRDRPRALNIHSPVDPGELLAQCAASIPESCT